MTEDSRPLFGASCGDSLGVGKSVIGLDIGGTKTRGVLIESGVVTRDELVGSANLQNAAKSQAISNLSALFAKLDNGRVGHVYAGSGGVDTIEDEAALTALIAPFVPSARISVVHDTRLLLAAGFARTGVAVIAGTGSAAWGNDGSGKEARSGGWGYLLGDEGSGYWLGREAVRYSLSRMNRGLPVDSLTTALLQNCGLLRPEQLIAFFHSQQTGRTFWAQQAQVVVQAAAEGHSWSRACLEQAGRDLSGLASQTLRQLGISGPVVLGGGLGMNVIEIQDSFCQCLREEGVQDVRILDQDPIFGVMQLIDDL